MIGFNAITTSEHFGAFLTFGVLHAALLIQYIKVITPTLSRFLSAEHRVTHATASHTSHVGPSSTTVVLLLGPNTWRPCRLQELFVAEYRIPVGVAIG